MSNKCEVTNDHQHCKHTTGIVQLTAPVRYGFYCCYCGEEWFESEPSQNKSEHGTYLRQTRKA